jgi:hypothetical protein
MPRRVHIDEGGRTFDLIETPAPSEHHLQEVIKMQPQLIPTEDLGLDGELIVVGRETTLASGAIDLLCLARSGDVVLVEFKVGPQNPDFRAALAQLIDYGSDLWRQSVEDFDRGVVQRYLSSRLSASTATDLASAVAATDWSLDEDEYAEFNSRLADVLATGDFIYVVAAQRFTEPMRSTLDYLNTVMRYGRFYLVELVQLIGSDLVAHSAQVVAAPPRRLTARTTQPRGENTDEKRFLGGIGDDAQREALVELFAACSSLGIEVKWRSQGASLRIRTPDRQQPLSIAWAFPPGEGWSVTRDLTLGVDRSSLAGTPTVAPAVEEYLREVKLIAGGVQVTGKNVEAVAFAPSTVPGALPGAVRALENLVQRALGDGAS